MHSSWDMVHDRGQTDRQMDERKNWHIEVGALPKRLIIYLFVKLWSMFCIYIYIYIYIYSDHTFKATEKWFYIYISCFVRVLFHLISQVCMFAILISCYFYIDYGLFVKGHRTYKSSSLRSSFQFILFEIVYTDLLT